MKLYNSNTDKIEKIQSVLKTDTGSIYVDKVQDSKLNELGYYRVKYNSIPNRRYYTNIKSGNLIDNVYVVSYVAVPKAIDEMKLIMLKDLSITKNKIQDSRPQVDTGLGFNVDGGYRDLQNLEGAKAMGLTFVIDVNGDYHSINVEDWDIVIAAIRMNGLSIIQMNSIKKNEIKALNNIEECILYESTPYMVNEEVKDIDGNGTGDFEDVTRYINNITNW